ncbi:hypothetical protein RB595_010683 [Gaeumannomyces hyphopodioides]
MAEMAAQATSTAPVLEHICLFTHDLKRKHKRWQDGRLKFHAFNQRVMVYDERGNFVGDAHWREDYDFGEGEELQLERGGTIVQVCECVGRHDQDLSELLDKRALDKSQRAAQVAARAPAASAAGLGSRPVVRQVLADHSQLRHRPLSQLLGTPTGHHGRAVVPSESPFEQRQKAAEDTPPPSKRSRREVSPPSKAGYAQNLFGTKLCLSSQPRSSALAWQSQSRPAQPAAPAARPTEPTAPATRPTGHLEGPLEVNASRPGPSPIGDKELKRPARGRIRPAAELWDDIELDEDTGDERLTSHAERPPQEDRRLQRPANDWARPAAGPGRVVQSDKENTRVSRPTRHAEPLSGGDEGLQRPAGDRARPAANYRQAAELDQDSSALTWQIPPLRAPQRAAPEARSAGRPERPPEGRAWPAVEPTSAIEPDKETAAGAQARTELQIKSRSRHGLFVLPSRAEPPVAPAQALSAARPEAQPWRREPRRVVRDPIETGPIIEPATAVAAREEAARGETAVEVQPPRPRGPIGPFRSRLGAGSTSSRPPARAPPPDPRGIFRSRPGAGSTSSRPPAPPRPPRPTAMEPRGVGTTPGPPKTPSAAPGTAPAAGEAQAAIEKPPGVSTTTGPWSRRETHDLLGMGRPGGWEKK